MSLSHKGLMKRMIVAMSAVALLYFGFSLSAATNPDPEELVKAAIDQWRGISSYGEVTMIIHRPDWQRKMTMTNWTRGDKDALIRFVAPVKDAGNATLNSTTICGCSRPSSIR